MDIILYYITCILCIFFLPQHDSIVSEPGGKKRCDGSNFRHGQPAYQSAIVTSTSSGLKKNRGKGKGWSNQDYNFGSGFRIAGGDESPTALSDIDIPSSVYSASSLAAFNNKREDSNLRGNCNDLKEKELQQVGQQ
jgi:hypothetical protein